MIENRKQYKVYLLFNVKTNPKDKSWITHKKVKLNGEDVFLVKEEDGFDEVVEASVDNKGNWDPRRIVSPSNKPVEAPISPVEPQTPEEAIVVPPEEQTPVVESVNLSYEVEEGNPNLKFYKVIHVNDKTAIMIDEIDSKEKGNVLENPTRFVETYFETNGLRNDSKLLDIKITYPAKFILKDGIAVLDSKGTAEYIYENTPNTSPQPQWHDLWRWHKVRLKNLNPL